MKKSLPLHQLSTKYYLNEVKGIIIWLFKKALHYFAMNSRQIQEKPVNKNIIKMLRLGVDVVFICLQGSREPHGR